MLSGFLCVSEFTIPSVTSYDPTCHLSMKDVAVDNRDNSHLLQVAIKQSKTDPFRRGVNIYLGATDSTICPVKAVLAYLVLRGGQAGPLFITQEGKGLTRLAFSSALDTTNITILTAFGLELIPCCPNSSLTTNITILTALGLELQLLPLKLGYQTVRSRCWDVGRAMPISAISKPFQRSLLSYQRNWLGTHKGNTFRNCYFNLPLVLFTYCKYYIQCIDSFVNFSFLYVDSSTG